MLATLVLSVSPWQINARKRIIRTIASRLSCVGVVAFFGAVLCENCCLGGSFPDDFLDVFSRSG